VEVNRSRDDWGPKKKKLWILNRPSLTSVDTHEENVQQKHPKGKLKSLSKKCLKTFRLK